jgi:photosystem II stability/assembly factor-like uncharacterized protein
MRFCSYFILLSVVFSGCLKEDKLILYKKIPTKTNDLLTCVHIDTKGKITILGGYVWSHCFSLTGTDPENLILDTISDKLLFDLQPIQNNQLIAVGADGYIYTSTENHWTLHRTTGWDILHSIKDDGSYYLAAGGKSYQTGYVYEISKTMQLERVQYFDFEISDIAITADQTVIAVGFGRVIRSDDGGHTWNILPVKGDFFASVVFTDEQTGFIIGYNGTLLKSSDSGKSWQNISSSLKGNGTNSFRKIVYLNNNLIILGNNGKIWRSTDNGDTWKYYRPDSETDFYSIAGWKSGYIIAGSGGCAALVDWDD